jgi:hypothetical protein
MVEIKLPFLSGERFKRCINPNCRVKNNIQNTLCWFCETKFPMRKKIIHISPNP